MADSRVLLLTGQQAVIYHWRGRRLLEPMAFGADDAGLRAFAGYLEGDPGTTLRVLLDVVEEEFKEAWEEDREKVPLPSVVDLSAYGRL